MHLTFTNNKKESLNSISDCFNGLMDELQKKKQTHDRNFKLKISSKASADTFINQNLRFWIWQGSKE